MADNATQFGYPAVEMPEWASSSPEAAVKFLVGQLVELGRLPAERRDEAVRSVLKRESLGSTALGRGVALPHAKCDAVAEVRGIVGRAAVPVKWPGAMDEEPIRTVCLMIAPIGDPRAMLRALESTVRAIKGE